MDLFAAYWDSHRNYSLKFSITFTPSSNGQMRLKYAYAAKESIPMKLSLPRRHFRGARISSRAPLKAPAWEAIWNLGSFPFVRAGRPDHCLTSQFDNEIGLFQEFLLKNHVLGAYYLGCDWSGRRVLIKREIIIATEKVGPVSSDKWKAPQGVAEFALFEGWDSRV